MAKLRTYKLPLVVAGLAFTLLACGSPPTGEPKPDPPPPGRLEACTDLAATVHIPDPVFRDYLHVRTGIPAGQPLTCGALRDLTQLYLGTTRTVGTLAGVEHMQGVTRVSLDAQHQLTDAEFDRLGALSNVTDLLIDGAAKLTSIEFVESFTALELLQVDDTALASLAGIENLTALSTMYVRGNPNLTSAAPVAGLTNLEVVQLNGAAITSLAPFRGLANLRRLMATDNALTSIDVSELPALEELQVTGNRLTSLPAMAAAGFPNLRTLSVANNALTTLAGLEGLTLQFLSASSNKLTTIHHIADLKGVRTLYLQDNYLTDMTPLGAVGWDGGATVALGVNCLGVLYFEESRFYSMPAGPNNEVLKELTMSEGVNVSLGPLATDNRCDGKPGY